MILFEILNVLFAISALTLSTDAFWMTSEVLDSEVSTIPSMNKREACQRNGSGEGILVNSVIYRYKEKQYCYQLVNASSLLMQTFRRHCNGKSRCLLSPNMTRSRVVSCDVTWLLANVIDVNYECKPIRADNTFVFDMKTNFRKHVTDIGYMKYYLVIEPHGTQTLRYCEVEGFNEHVQFTLLHSEFGPRRDCQNVTELDPSLCYGYINVTINRTEQRYYTWSRLPGETLNVLATSVVIEVNISTGLIWIEVAANKDFMLECKGHMNDLESTSTFTAEANTTKATLCHGYSTNKTCVFEADNETLHNTVESHYGYRYVKILIMPGLIAVLSLVGIMVLIKSNVHYRKNTVKSDGSAELAVPDHNACSSFQENAVPPADRCIALKRTIVYTKGAPLNSYSVPTVIITPPQ